jgi:predicted  nucleic acid-binding Zn-ribbon protein
MADEERNQRFERALATLSELAANHDSRMAALTELAAVQNRRADVHERRIEGLEEAYALLVRLARSQQNGMDEIRAAQAETDHKLAALVDAQMQTEQALQRLAGAQERLDKAHERLAESQKQLAESQRHSDRRLDALIDVVQDLVNRRKAEGESPDSG